ncbi:CD225/dispanin family protein [Rhodococcus sp. NPDC049939]|uniref:CD225/dispanin family protein n=1 Tax=Rhodococcus sp. NPDC049939 TaxID=3155511 RepID=UPI0034119A4C
MTHCTDKQPVDGEHGPLAPPPASHLPLAILAIIAFFPLGVMSLTRSVTVGNLWEQGDYDASVRASADAKSWAMRSFSAAVALTVLASVGVLLGQR